jgi:DNA-binding transcriptional MerR regulator
MTVYCYNKSMIKKRYTIGQLSELTGFSRRTIRYYVAEGLLDPPAGRGRGGFYFDSHLEVLRRIRFLREKGVRLSAIFEMLRKDAALQVSPERRIWVKYEIEPGVEILVERGLEEQRSKDVAEVVRVARSILSKGGKDNV